MNKYQQIVRLMIQKLKTMPNGTETTVTDLLNMILFDTDERMTIDDFFEIDALLEERRWKRDLFWIQ